MSCKNILYNNLFNRINIAHKNINDIVLRTPLEYNTRLSNIYNCDVFLKREDLQKVRSFKIRGAYNKINNLNNKQKINGVVCASAGNHAQGVAYICREKDIIGDIFLPNSIPIQKINRIKYFSNNKTKIHITGNNFDETLKYSLEFCEKNDKSFIHPYDDIETIIGQATIGKEIYEQLNYSMPDVIISGIGGGGLISGISLFNKYGKYSSKIIGTEPELCASMLNSINNNKITEIINPDLFVDGAAVKIPGDLTFDICNELVDEIYPISNGRLCKELLDLYQDDGIISEPAGALSICGLDNIENIKGKTIVCILSGGNNDITRYPEIVDKYLVYENLKHYYIIKFAQKPGELKKFINNILEKDDDIIRFEYIKKTNINYGNVLVGIQVSNPNNIKLINNKLKNNMFDFTKINETDSIYKYII